MSTHGLEWDEDRGGPRHPLNKISAPTSGNFCRATARVLPWEPAGAHDAGNDRSTVPSIYIERLFRRASVPDPESLAAHRLNTKCLGVPEYLDAALDLLTAASGATRRETLVRVLGEPLVRAHAAAWGV